MDGYKQVSTQGATDPVAIAEKVEIVEPFDGIEEAAIATAVDVERGQPVRVRVVAPMTLVGGYKLVVKTPEGESFYVLVPEHGIREGEQFEAYQFQSHPIEGRFSDDICSCCSAGQGNFFLLAWCCNGLAYGTIMEKLKLTWCAGRSFSPTAHKKTFAIVAGLWLTFYVLNFTIQFIVRLSAQPAPPSYSSYSTTTTSSADPGAVVGLLMLPMYALAIYFLVIQIKTRMAFRAKYMIPGDCCTDCLASYFCSCCSALQMYRHMKRSGEPPARFAPVSAEAEIV